MFQDDTLYKLTYLLTDWVVGCVTTLGLKNPLSVSQLGQFSLPFFWSW